MYTLEQLKERYGEVGAAIQAEAPDGSGDMSSTALLRVCSLTLLTGSLNPADWR